MERVVKFVASDSVFESQLLHDRGRDKEKEFIKIYTQHFIQADNMKSGDVLTLLLDINKVANMVN